MSLEDHIPQSQSFHVRPAGTKFRQRGSTRAKTNQHNISNMVDSLIIPRQRKSNNSVGISNSSINNIKKKIKHVCD